MLVAGCVNLFACADQHNHDIEIENIFRFMYHNNEIYKKIFQVPNNACGTSNNTCFKPLEMTKLYENLKGYSIIDHTKFLQSLIPFASNYNGSMIATLKLAIKTLNSEINILSDDSKNFHDLISTNQQLKNKCEKLENELNAIKQIINKT